VKTLITLPLFFFISVAMANQNTDLSVGDFQEMDLFQDIVLEKAERVFRDELALEDVYKIYYWEGECAGHLATCEVVLSCKYFTVDTAYAQKGSYFVEATDISCDKDIEEVIGDPTLIEEF